ncbi:MAG TPA: ATP/GTP-binding protein [Candidatus Deferrimicrobium sp.]|nr:ATP/GTP-binding protein [Candidatus Deferrimicrobium sp.]
MVIVEFFIGCAGTGKTTLTGIYRDWLNDQPDLDAIAINFDPGAMWLPYKADIDIRDYIRIEDVMEQYKLGPNGALVASTDLTINFLSEIKKEINELRPNHILVDTPGQMELFAFRSSGLYIFANLGGKDSVVNYLIDPNLAKRPSGFVTALYLGLSIQTRFYVPQQYILSKIDLLSEEETETIVEWSTDFDKLENALNLESKGERRELNNAIIQALRVLNISGELLPISSVENIGISDLYRLISQIALGGEDFSELT